MAECTEWLAARGAAHGHVEDRTFGQPARLWLHGAFRPAPLARKHRRKARRTIKFINAVVDNGINYIDTSIDYGWSERC